MSKVKAFLCQGNELKQIISFLLKNLESRIVLLRRLNDWVVISHFSWKKVKVYKRLPIPKKYKVAHHRFRRATDSQFFYNPSRNMIKWK